MALACSSQPETATIASGLAYPVTTPELTLIASNALKYKDTRPRGGGGPGSSGAQTSTVAQKADLIVGFSAQCCCLRQFVSATGWSNFKLDSCRSFAHGSNTSPST